MAGIALKRHCATSVLETQTASANQRQKQVRHGIDAALPGDVVIYKTIIMLVVFGEK